MFRDQFGKDTVYIPNGVAVVPEQEISAEDDPLPRIC